VSSGATTVNVTLGETGSVEIYRLQPAASDPQSTHELKLNGELLQLDAAGGLPPMAGVGGSGVVEVGPLDVVFAVMPQHAAAACAGKAAL